MMMGGLAAVAATMALQALLAELSGLKKPRGLLQPRGAPGARACGRSRRPSTASLVVMATNMPEALDHAMLRPGRIDRIYKVGYPVEGRAGSARTRATSPRCKHELTDERGRAAGDDHAVRHRRDDQGHRQRGADRSRSATAATRSRGPTSSRRSSSKTHGLPDDWRVHRARAARDRGARGVSRGRRLPCSTARSDRRRDDRAPRRHRWFRLVDPARGPLHHVAVRATTSTSWSSLASLAGERMFFDGDNSNRRGRRPPARDAGRDRDGGASAGMGQTIASHGVTKAWMRGGGQAVETGTDRQWLETAFGEARRGAAPGAPRPGRPSSSTRTASRCSRSRTRSRRTRR